MSPAERKALNALADAVSVRGVNVMPCALDYAAARVAAERERAAKIVERAREERINLPHYPGNAFFSGLAAEIRSGAELIRGGNKSGGET